MEYGESEIEAARRELVEETSVKAVITDKIELVKAHFEGQDYDLHDYVARWVSGDPVAGDDAADARFVPISDLAVMGMWPKTVEIIRRAHAMSES